MKKNIQTQITVGLSANPTFSFVGADNPGKEKGSLSNKYFKLTGSTPNIAECLKALGLNPTIVVPFEFGAWSHEAKVLDFLLDELEFSLHR